MKSIAIYMGSFPREKTSRGAADQLKYDLVKGVIDHFPETALLLITEGESEVLFRGNENLQHRIIKEPPATLLSLQRYYHHRLLTILTDDEPDLFLSLTGTMPKKYKGETLIILPDELVFIAQKKRKTTPERFYHKNLTDSLPKASHLLTFSTFSKDYFVSSYPISEKEIQVLRPFFDPTYHPLEWEEREAIKEKYANEKEYILYPGDLRKKSSLLLVLKAFSLLKKKMNSTMVLVLTGDQEKTFKKFPELIRTYHFGKDVKLTGTISISESAALIGAAYCCVLTSSEASYYSPVTDMVRCHTPAIVPKGSIHEAAGGEAVLSFNAEDYTDLGAHFCTLYRDEELRAKLIQQAEIQTTQTSAESEMTLLSDIIRKINKEQK